jgi:GNAT superfamily N-acetyltransferase
MEGAVQPDGAGTITIRRAQAADSERIALLCDQWGYPTSVVATNARLHALSQQPEDVIFVAETADGIVVGWVHVVVRLSLAVDRYAEIGGLVVDSVCRSRGIGERLMDVAEQWGREQGCGHMRARSNVVRERAHHFYERLGYKRIKSQAVFVRML